MSRVSFSRRETLAASLGAVVLAACGPKKPSVEPSRGPALLLGSASALVSAANVVWAFELKPRAIFSRAELIPAVSKLISEENFTAFSKRHGGIDLRQIEELVVARYPKTDFSLAKVRFEPARVEASFTERVLGVEGRAIDPANPEIVRLWGDAHGERTQVAMFGREMVALETGQFAPVRVAELFAQGRLKKSLPISHAEPFARVRELLGQTDARIISPGPFEGEWQKALGGLLRATAAVGVGVRVREESSRAFLDTRMVLLGSWGEDTEAEARLVSGLNVILSTGFAKLINLGSPVASPKVTRRDDALVVDASWDALRLADGLHTAVDASVSEIFQRI